MWGGSGSNSGRSLCKAEQTESLQFGTGNVSSHEQDLRSGGGHSLHLSSWLEQHGEGRGLSFSHDGSAGWLPWALLAALFLN